MAFKWKTSNLQTGDGRVTITYWDKLSHAPHKLLRLLKKKPRRIIGEHPPVSLHRFGPHLVSMREFHPRYAQSFADPNDLFRNLQRLVQLRTAIVEMPVAFIERGAKPPVILTLFKKNTRSFIDFMNNRRVAVALRRKAAINAIRRLAQLHAAGFEHRHPLNNLVADRRGNVMLVDYTFLRKGRSRESLEHQIGAISFGMAWAIYKRKFRKIGSIQARDFGSFAREVEKRQHVEQPSALYDFAAQLEKEYGKAYAKQLQKLGSA